MKKNLNAAYLCSGCGGYFGQKRDGRPRRYCSDACKQHSYRERKKTAKRYEMAADQRGWR